MSPTLRWLGFLSLVGWGCVYLALFGWFKAHSQDFIVERRSARLCAGSACPAANLPMRWDVSEENSLPETLIAGWGRPESDGAWSVQREAAIHLPVGRGLSGCLEVTLRMAAAGQAGQTVHVRLGGGQGGQAQFEWWVEGQGSQTEMRLSVPASAADERGVLRLRLMFPDAYRPAKRASSPDKRLLGAKLSRVAVKRVEYGEEVCTPKLTLSNGEGKGALGAQLA